MLAILLGHAGVIALLLRRAMVAPAPEREVLTVYPIHLMPMVEPQPTSPRLENPARRRATTLPVTPTIVVPAAEPQQGLVVEPVQPPDWGEEGSRAAERIVRGNPAPRQFGEARQKPEPLAEPPSVFTKPAHVAGEIQVLGPGVERRWVSEHCYVEYGHPPPLFPGAGPRVNPVRCNVGSREARGDLFDHLKPKYLKQQEPSQTP